MVLKPRLETVLRSVPADSVVADIGTDHAFLPIALSKRGIAKKVIACDINEGPLLVARTNVTASGLNNIELRLGDGLDKISAREVNVITVCGLGGDVIRDILKKAPWIRDEKITLVLQANSSADELRRWLYDNKFDIVREVGVIEKGRKYSVITAMFCNRAVSYTIGNVFIGKLAEDKTEASRQYIRLQYDRLTVCLDSIKDIPKKRLEYNEYSEAVAEIGEVLKNFQKVK